MSENKLRYYGVLLLRIALGTMFIAHSVIYMTMTLTLAGTVDFFASLGLPPWFAYATILAEALGGLLLILGVQTRWVALALSPILLGAIWVHSGNGWLFASRNGGWEYPLYLFVLCIAQAMLGDGAHALSPSWLLGARATSDRAQSSKPPNLSRDARLTADAGADMLLGSLCVGFRTESGPLGRSSTRFDSYCSRPR